MRLHEDTGIGTIDAGMLDAAIEDDQQAGLTEPAGGGVD